MTTLYCYYLNDSGVNITQILHMESLSRAILNYPFLVPVIIDNFYAFCPCTLPLFSWKTETTALAFPGVLLQSSKILPVSEVMTCENKEAPMGSIKQLLMCTFHCKKCKKTHAQIGTFHAIVLCVCLPIAGVCVQQSAHYTFQRICTSAQ